MNLHKPAEDNVCDEHKLNNLKRKFQTANQCEKDMKSNTDLPIIKAIKNLNRLYFKITWQ